MDTIYSRRKIRFPKIIYQKFGGMDPKKRKKKIQLFIIIIVAVITFQTVIQSITPILETLCKDKAKSIATIICNEESTKIIKQYQYEDLITIHRDSNNDITMLQSNVVAINLIISDVGEKIQKRINEIKSEETEFSLGGLTGSTILSGLGPKIPVSLSIVGNVETDLRNEFESKGINQTIHRIYLQVECKISILTPYKKTEEKILNQVLIAENIIIGKIPEAYYNLEGINTQNAIDVIE